MRFLNQRNPYCQLPTGNAGDSVETAADQVEEAGDDVKSAWPLRPRLSDPQVAIIELIANSYQAGATEIRITWPEETGGTFEIVDHDTGMTRDQFVRKPHPK